MSILKVVDLCFSYDEKNILKNINIDIKEGSITALLGRNGAGKSTLFLNINGVYTPNSGDVYFFNERVVYNRAGIEKMRRSVGIVFQDPNDQLFSTTVLKDVSFGLLNLGLSKDDAYEKSIKALETVGMLEYKDRPIHTLSYGQKKRVAIAGVIAMQPKLIILDEPTAGLDPMGVNEILTLLKKIKDEESSTIIIATHDMDIVPLYCDYAYVMDNGEIVLSGVPDELFSHADMLRKYSLRLPRISHLMEILRKCDNIPVGENISTISRARKAIKDLLHIK